MSKKNINDPKTEHLSTTDSGEAVLNDDFFYQNLWDDEKFKTPTPTLRNTEEAIFSKRKLSFWYAFLIVFGLYFIFSIWLSNVLFQPLQVVGASMYPTMNHSASAYTTEGANDVVYIDHSKKPQYGDIVVFDSSFTTGRTEYYIKRVIATEGDTLTFVRTSDITFFERTATGDIYCAKYVVYKNGKLLQEDYIREDMLMSVGYPKVDQVNASSFYKSVVSEETLTVPKGCVFVMGDNRNESMDSRDFGFVPTEQIIGKVRVHIEYGKPLIVALVHSIKENYLF